MKNHDLKLAASILDALEYAKQACSFLPPLPPDMKPVYIRILNAIYKLRSDNGNVCVSDISKVAGIVLPNTTRFIRELEELNVVEKFTLVSDKRVVLVRTTDLGEQYIQRYVLSFHKELEKEFSSIGKSDCKTMIETIQKVYQAMQKVYQDKKN